MYALSILIVLLFPATFEKGLIGNFSDAKDSLQLWTAYCDYLRRRVDTGGEGEEEEEGGEGGREAELTELRKTFKRARDNLDACETVHA